MDLWIYGSMDLWIYGFMDLWIYGIHSFVTSTHTFLFLNMDNRRSRKRKREVQFLSKNQMSSLFRKTERFHRRRLREMFRKHYWPIRADDEWTIGISHDVIQEFKLHLSWDLGLNVFHLNRTQIGIEILKRFKQLGILVFLKKIIRDEDGL